MNQNKPNELRHQLGFFTAVTVVVGSMIGSGIFRKPGLMAGELASPEWLIAVWIIAGFMTLFGALSIAEIAGMYSTTGGQYIYFNKIYNPFVGFLYGWAVFAVIQTGSIASITYVFSEYFNYFVPLPHFSPELEKFGIPLPWIGEINPFKEFGTKALTIGIILFLTTVNYFGAKFGGFVQNVFTSLKVSAIGFLVLVGFLIGEGTTANFSSANVDLVRSGSLFAAIMLAMSGAFWAYDGWINITYLSGEVKNPQKVVPKALFIGTVIVISVYVIVNLAYLYLLPIDKMAQSKLVASDAAVIILGTVGGGFVALSVMCSTFGTSNGTQMASARVYYAMAREGYFFKAIGKVHPKFNTPGNSLLLQGLWASALVLSGTFDQLTDMLIFVSWIFYALAAFGVFILRWKLPNAERPYKTWGYPLVPALFVIFASVYVGWTLYADIVAYINDNTPLINSAMGLLLVAIGIPLYLYWDRKNKRETVETTL
jgi:APA family basic amino acid/polyamine antiporter